MSWSVRRVLLATLVALVILLSYALRIRSGMTDFAVNYRAGQRLRAGETLYQTADGHYMFKYLPASALLYLPLTYFPIEVAKATWFAISLLTLVWAFRVVDQLLPPRHSPFVVAVAALVLAKYFLHELRLGQINILVTLAMLLGLRALVSDPPNQKAAGALAGLATALKPYAALFFPYLLLTRQWLAAVVGAVVLIAALAVPAAFYGIQGNLLVLRDWASTLSQSTPALLTNNDNVSVVAFFAKWLGSPSRALGASLVVLAGLAALMLAVIVRRTGRQRPSVLEGAMLLTLIPLVSPLGWDYTFLMSLLAVALLIAAFHDFPGPAQVLLVLNFTIIALAIFDLIGRQAYATFMQWSVTTVNFVAVVLALAYLRFRTQL